MANNDAYAFLLDAIDHDVFYFRTVSLWDGPAKHERDMRRAYPVISANFETVISSLGNSCMWVNNNDEDLEHWFRKFGWMLTPVSFVKERLGSLLADHECVRSPLGLFWDIDIPRNRASGRRTGHLRNQVLERDEHQCVLCGRAESAGAELTMDHVIPFSRGGETTIDNLVTLCSECNNRLGNDLHPQLFGLAGLHHGWDPKEVKTRNLSSDVLDNAMKLSQNILVSRCRNDSIDAALSGQQEVA